MSRLFEVPTPIRVERLTRVMRVRGVDVYVHWTVFAITAIILFNAPKRPLVALIGVIAYFSVLFIHECGHIIAAIRKHCEVFSIELYPIWGITRFQAPWSRYDHCVIAWGGVLAQTVVALPVIGVLAVFGYPKFEPVNVVLGLLGGFSLIMAVFNLLPVPPLDGSIAWGIFPAMIERTRKRKSRAASKF